jgi:asparagine N-glycosylation enzyme membrane subunit Stt3
MLYTIIAILLILWLLGVVGVYSIGWFIHILLIAAIILFLVRIIEGRNPVR